MRVRIVMTMAIGILIAVSSLARAQSGGGYDLTWHTVDNGGASFSTGGGYQLSGGDYTLAGGFWGAK